MTDTTTPTTTLPPARRLPVAAWRHMLRAEAMTVARDTAGMVIPFGLPTLLMVMNGVSQDGEVLPDGTDVMSAIVMPLTITMVVALVGLVNMPPFLAMYRKTGVLRRLSVTPARPVLILLAQVLVSLAQAIVGVALMMVIAVVFFDVTLPQQLGWALLVGVLLVAAMYGLGMLVAAVAPTVNSSLALALIAFFLMAAVGGGLGPTASLPEWLQTLGEALPYGAGTEALSAAWAGSQPEAAHLITLGAWGVVSGGLAAKLFRWA